MDERQRRLAEELLFSGKEKPSFAKLLFFGIFDSNRVFPYPQVSMDEQVEVNALLNQVREFAEREIDADAIDRGSEIPGRVIEGLGKLGVLGLTIPKEYGGLGLSQNAYCRVEEYLAGKCGSTALFVNAHQSVGLKALLLFGTEKQKKRWLRPLATGEAIAAFSLTEPNAGSDASAIETTATYDAEKKVYRINGRKQWTTNGSIAQVLTVMAKTAEDEITAFLVTPEMKGFHVIDKKLDKVGMRGTWTSNLAFDNCEVPEENILGPKGKGLRVCLTVLDYGRTTFGATCTGVGKILLEKAKHHAQTRHQFGQPLSAFPLIQAKLAKMAGLVYAMDATTYLTAGLLDGNESDIMLEAAILKVFTSEALWDIVYETMQIYGGRSFFTDEPMERMMRDARLNMIGEGANEVLRAFIGVVGMRDVGMQLKEGASHPKEYLRFAQSLWGRLFAPRLPFQSKEGVALSRATKQFSWSIIRLLMKHREEIVEEQLHLNRIATSAISLYTTAAVISKLESSQPTYAEKMAAQYYCQTSLQMLHRSLHALSHNRDEKIEAVSNSLFRVTI